MENKKRVILIIPSDIIARGLESILTEQGDFLVQENLVDFSRGSEAKLRNLSPDVVIVDPAVFDYQSRKESRILIADSCDASVLALEGPSVTDDILKQYDGAISVYDDMACVARKVNAAIDSKQPDMVADGNELSAREKEILVCRPGNAQQGDSGQVQPVHLHGHHPPEEHHPQDRHQDRRRPHRLCYPQQSY